MTTVVRRGRMTLPELLWSGWPFDGPPAWLEGMHPIRVEEFRDGDSLVMRAELPGMDPAKDIEIDVTDGVLTITAERRQDVVEGEEGKAGYRSEFHYGSYRRSLTLPRGANAEDIKAGYTNGVLEVRVPIAATPAAQKVPISITEQPSDETTG